jgi:hypothetical protein
MNKRYEAFSQTQLGQQIVKIISQPNRQIEFNAFSREGFPAVTALISELSPVLLPLKSSDPKAFNFAKQFVGDFVGDMMRGAGRKIERQAKSVPGKLFSVGAVWSSS